MSRLPLLVPREHDDSAPAPISPLHEIISFIKEQACNYLALLEPERRRRSTRMQLLGSLNICRITHSCTHTSDV